MNSNIIKKLDSGISVFGWYTDFDVNGNATVHVDVNFGTGKFGGTELDQVQFELDFKRVEVIVLCGDGVKPIKSSIARIIDNTTITTETTKEIDLIAETSGKAGFSVENLKANAEASISGKASSATKTKISKTEVAAAIVIRHLLTQDRHPTWDIRESTGSALKGTPWDPNKEPRFTFKFISSKIDKDPPLRVIVRCRKEDLILKNIEIKDQKKAALFKARKHTEANRVAAEQFLKDLLLKEGLPLPIFENKFGEVVVADVVLTIE